MEEQSKCIHSFACIHLQLRILLALVIYNRLCKGCSIQPCRTDVKTLHLYLEPLCGLRSKMRLRAQREEGYEKFKLEMEAICAELASFVSRSMDYLYEFEAVDISSATYSLDVLPACMCMHRGDPPN